MNKTSFLGTYKIESAKNSERAFSSASDLQLNPKINQMCYENYDDFSNPYSTYVVSDGHDEYVEAFLKSRGVNFTKFSQNDCSSLENIKKRMVIEPYFKNNPRFSIVEIDTKRFDELYASSNPECYFEKGYTDKQTIGFIEYIKSNEPINASYVCLNQLNNKPVVCFCDGRHRYSYLRDIGMKSIPIMMDENSIEIAKSLNLIV